MSTEEAVLNDESPRVVIAGAHKHDDTIFADIVSTRHGVLRSPSHAAETSAVAHDGRPPALESHEVVCMNASRRFPCSKLLAEAGQMCFDHIDQATPQDEVVCLFKRDKSSFICPEQC